MRGNYIRGDQGRFAGSTGGWGAGRRRGGGASGGGGSGITYVKTGKGYTPKSHGLGLPGSRTATHRLYVQQGRRYSRPIAVTQIRNGRATLPSQSLMTRRAIGGHNGITRAHIASNTRSRIGAPLGNTNTRYVTHAQTLTGAYGRAGSTRTARHAIRTNTPPRSGYLVHYGPRTRN